LREGREYQNDRPDRHVLAGREDYILMNRSEELQDQQAFIDAGKATTLPEFTAQDVAIMLHKRRAKYLAKLVRRLFKHAKTKHLAKLH
jgi:hypothetical protein